MKDRAPEELPEGTRLRLPRSSRLLRRQDFRRVYGEGVRLHGRLILVIAAPSTNCGGPRLGLSVSRKYCKSAVLRNRVRRRLREAFRELRPRLAPMDVVLVPRARPDQLRYAELRDELMTLLCRGERKLGLCGGS